MVTLRDSIINSLAESMDVRLAIDKTSTYDESFVQALEAILGKNAKDEGRYEWWCAAFTARGGHGGLEFNEIDEARTFTVCNALKDSSLVSARRREGLLSAVIEARRLRI